MHHAIISHVFGLEYSVFVYCILFRVGSTIGWGGTWANSETLPTHWRVHQKCGHRICS